MKNIMNTYPSEFNFTQKVVTMKTPNDDELDKMKKDIKSSNTL